MKYPNRIYKSKKSAEKAAKREGGIGVKEVGIVREGRRVLSGYGIEWPKEQKKQKTGISRRLRRAIR